MAHSFHPLTSIALGLLMGHSLAHIKRIFKRPINKDLNKGSAPIFPKPINNQNLSFWSILRVSSHSIIMINIKTQVLIHSGSILFKFQYFQQFTSKEKSAFLQGLCLQITLIFSSFESSHRDQFEKIIKLEEQICPSKVEHPCAPYHSLFGVLFGN